MCFKAKRADTLPSHNDTPRTARSMWAKTDAEFYPLIVLRNEH